MARETRSPSYASHLSPGSRGLSLSDSWFEMPLTSATRLMPSVDSSAARASFTSVAICAADCVARGSNSRARKVWVHANTPLASSSAIRKKVRQNRLRATGLGIEAVVGRREGGDDGSGLKNRLPKEPPMVIPRSGGPVRDEHVAHAPDRL